MNATFLFIVGMIGAATYSALAIIPGQSPTTRGVLLAILSAVTIASTILIGLKEKDKPSTPRDTCYTLGYILFNIQTYTLLFNAFCIFLSEDPIWDITVIESVLVPIILAGFNGKTDHKRMYELASSLAIILAIVIYSCYPGPNSLFWQAAFSYSVCMLIPGGLEWSRLRRQRFYYS